MNTRISEGFRILGDSVRLEITTCRRVMRRFLRRFLEVGIEHLQVMLASDRFRIAEPGTDDVRREMLFQFRLT